MRCVQRGPDAEPAVLWNAGLQAHRRRRPRMACLNTRLSIIDPRPDANQPMANAAGDVWVAYNGEVYDWAADARTLSAAGFHFRTRSDTEFILHAYEHWGLASSSGCAACLRWPSWICANEPVYVVRDRLGLKPVVYAHRPDGFAFASTVRALLPWLPCRRARSSRRRASMPFSRTGRFPRRERCLRGMRRLPPAHYLRYDLASAQSDRARVLATRGIDDPWLPTLDAAIQMRTVADRPLGLFLSSGIDSACVACRLAGMGHAGLQTFTAAFPGTSFDESADARATRGAPRVAKCSPSRSRSASRAISLASSPISTSRSPTRAACRCGNSPAKRRATSRSFWAATGATSCLAGISATRSICAPAGGAESCCRGCERLRSSAARGWQRIAEELRLDWRSAYVLRFSGMMPRERSVPASRISRRQPALLAHAGDYGPCRPRDAARNRPPELFARLHSAQGRPLHDGAWARNARAVPRPSLCGLRHWPSCGAAISPRPPNCFLRRRWRQLPISTLSRARSGASIRPSPAGCGVIWRPG